MELLTTAQVVELLKIKSRTLWDYRRAGLLKAVKVRHRVFFRTEDIKLFIETHLKV